MSNIILVMSDEHNPFISSPYGHAFVDTPNMQKLADSGTVYDSAYCPSPLCLPCRAGFMSGKHIHDIQVYNNLIFNMNPNQESYGRALARQGVHTTHIGKVDVFDKGENLGFSEMLLPADRHALHIEVSRKPLDQSPSGAPRATEYGVKPESLNMDIQRTDLAVDWIMNTAPQLDKQWVLVVNLIKPHFPHYVTQELWDRYADNEDMPAYGTEVESAQHPYAQDLRHYFSTSAFTDKNIREQRRGYYGCVTFVDQQLGRIVTALEDANLSESTNVIYTSDHGEMLGKFGMWWKSSLYEDSARVPLIASGPDFEAGQRVQTPVSLMDVQATFFDLTQTECPSDWVGESLNQVGKNDPERVAFSEYHGHGTRASAYMIRKGNWKYIHYIDAPHQLFNLADDPDELQNLYHNNLEIATEFEAELRSICSPELEQDRAEAYIQRQIELVEEHTKNS
jgi:choline-sulfatase